jgi:ribosomal protein S18 acetylase RimI-like enzyme
MPGKPVKIKVHRACSQDKTAVMRMLACTNFFKPYELQIAEEVFDDAIAEGPKGDYQSFVARGNCDTIGWICFGRTPCTVGTFDIYWVVVDPENQNRGIGAFLMGYAADFIKKHKGRMILVDTAGNPRYLPTRRFYKKVGYRKAACLKDFYADGDDKIIYIKRL